jgi:hypothetical protein
VSDGICGAHNVRKSGLRIKTEIIAASVHPAIWKLDVANSTAYSASIMRGEYRFIFRGGRKRVQRAFVLSMLILFTCVGAFSQKVQQQAATASTTASASRTQAMQSLDESSSNIEQLLQVHEKMVQISGQQAKIFSDLSGKIENLSKLAGQKGTSQAQLMQAIQNMQETQMSFNLQYLQLQNSMQNENRQFTMVSNIMKTKHDTAKNAIGNIR